jgi:hypothetical protein
LIVLVILPSAWQVERQYDAGPSQTSPANAISKTSDSKAGPSYILADATSLDPPLTVYRPALMIDGKLPGARDLIEKIEREQDRINKLTPG